MQFNANINVNFRAQPELIEALGNIGTFLETLVFIRENEKAASPNTVPDALQKALQTGAQEAEEPKAEEAKAENPEIKVERPAESEADPKAKVSGKELVGLRREVQGFCESGGRDKLSAWLKEHKLKKVPDCTNAQAAEMIAYIRKEGGKDA